MDERTDRYILAGYRGRTHDYERTEPGGTFLWFATQDDLAQGEPGADPEAVAYALRARIASDESVLLEVGGEQEPVQVLNVEVSADDHETGGGHKTVSALLRRRPAAEG